MKNQNSASQEPSAETEGRGSHPTKKKFFASPGKKKTVIVTVLAVLLLTGIGGRGFVLGARDWNHRGLPFWGTGSFTLPGVALTAKDFEPLGIVFVEDISATRRNGYGITYDALMKEAVQKGADAIINVNVSSTRSFFKRTWSGSALAIKYLDTVSVDGAVGAGPQGIISEIANTALIARGFKRNWF